MKLTKKQISSLYYVLRNLERARDYLMSKDTAVCHKGTFASTTLHYSRADGSTLYEVEKTYGSDLTGLFNGIESIKSLLNPVAINSQGLED
uniref:Uncharacterized protein n=1 Tax=viral metagenome TaxID=1070528 RepID=A0A6M3L0R5_9ZZZZ